MCSQPVLLGLCIHGSHACYGLLLPVMPVLFLRLLIDSSFHQHSPWFQRDIEGAMRKAGGGRGALGDWIMMGALS